MSLQRKLVIAVALLAIAWYPLRRWCAGGAVDPKQFQQNLEGKVAIVTGGNTGIGYETALQLARQNATVVIAGRDRVRVNDAIAAIHAAVPDAQVSGMTLDLASLKSVRAFAEEFREKYNRLHYLVNNAGVMTPPAANTTDGFELQFGVNHLGHFLLTEELLPLLKSSAPSRIIVVSSMAHSTGHIDFEDLNGWSKPYLMGVQQYAHSKLANILHARELARRLNGTGVTAYSLHPGAVRTELQRHFGIITTLSQVITTTIWKSPWEGAQTTLHTILDPSLPETSNGEYFADCEVKGSFNAEFRDVDVAARLYEVSKQLVSQAGNA